MTTTAAASGFLPQVLLALIVEEMEGAADPAGAPLRLRLSGGPDERGLAHRRRACQAARGREQERTAQPPRRHRAGAARPVLL